MNIKWTKTEDWHIARFRMKNLDDCTQESEVINAYIESLPPGSKVALSFRGVEWISSRVLGMILSARALAVKSGSQFAITSPSPKVMEALKITKLDRTLTIKESTNDLV